MATLEPLFFIKISPFRKECYKTDGIIKLVLVTKLRNEKKRIYL